MAAGVAWPNWESGLEGRLAAMDTSLSLKDGAGDFHGMSILWKSRSKTCKDGAVRVAGDGCPMVDGIDGVATGPGVDVDTFGRLFALRGEASEFKIPGGADEVARAEGPGTGAGRRVVRGASVWLICGLK